jgi:hypothetical protein
MTTEAAVVVARTMQAAITACLANGAVRATKYLSPREVCRVTRRRYRGKVTKAGPVELVMTLGRPNYRERAQIRQLQKAGEPFPVKKIRLEGARVPR